MSLEPGAALGAFQIVGLIGAGGMGEVYRARDTRLHRDVAVKVLPAGSAADETARERLVREARTASTLNHPNICTMYDAGIAGERVYIAMELVEGVALSALLAEGALPVDRATRYAIQIADGLAHAHQRGVVHRDLKSANVAITPDGRVKILDFGLAKRTADAGDATATAVSLTEPGTIVGTVAYMAPEVLKGGAADARSDLWALGVILFEMLTGSRPFTGASVFELTSAILTTAMPPLPPTVPGGIASIIESALAKAPGERYQQAVELRAALDAVSRSGSAPAVIRPRRPRRWWAAAAALAAVVSVAAVPAWRWLRPPANARVAVRAIAVLPLSNLSGDPAQEIFADGITDALITDLARVKGLDVISRTSVMQYKHTTQRLPDIARELTVDAVVQGSVMRSGNRVRVSAQLIDAVHDRHLWADDYDRDVSDVLLLQREVARAIAGEVRDTLTPQEEAALAGGRRVAPEAHDRYLRAKALILRFNEESISEAIRLCEEALQIDPEFAGAWAALASAHSERGIWGRPPSSRETGERARAAVTRALALEPENPEAMSILGMISMVYDWNFVAAERALDRGVELSAGGTQVRNLRSTLYQALRRFPEGVADAERSRRLDPASFQTLSALGRARYRARMFDEAIEAFKQSIALDPAYIANYARIADVYIALGNYPDAIAWLERGQQMAGSSRRQLDGLAVAYALAGRRREAETIRRQLVERSQDQDQTFYSLAMVDTALGNHDAAFEWLNRAFAARSANLWLVNGDHKFDALRKDPRFTDLLRRMGFPNP